MVNRFFTLTEVREPRDVVVSLARGADQWKKGYSAYELATCWLGAGGIPPAVRAVLDGDTDYRGAELIEGIFERKVNLRTAGRNSQTDLMLLIKAANRYAVIAVEGKVEESFDRLVSEWNNQTQGRINRLASLCRVLELPVGGVGHLRYQLLHRTVSAIYEAQRYGCRHAMMLVHSFSRTGSWFDDFRAFSDALGIRVPEANVTSAPKLLSGIDLKLAWVSDLPGA